MGYTQRRPPERRKAGMTLQDFTILRRDELVAFFRERFGKPWCKIVSIQAGMHPRWYDRWKGVSPLSLYRQINKLDTWARSIGFKPASDAEVERALQAHKDFKEAATRAIEETKRTKAAEAEKERESRQMLAQIAAAMQRIRDENIQQAAAEKAETVQRCNQAL
jgi:hypothetical protein